MVEWIEPVFDRTQADVAFAISKIEEWRNNGSNDVYELKGCLNVSDINRIEQDIQYLSDRLSTLCYFPNTESKTWSINDLPDAGEIARIINNVAKIITAFYQKPDAPELPETVLTYAEINQIEENLYHIKDILENMILLFRECGTFECGEE